MALTTGKPNPLNYFNIRRVFYAPPYFTYTFLNDLHLMRRIVPWIEENLNHRFFVGQDIVLDQQNNFKYVLKIGFESEKELSFFNIACPFLNNK